MSDIDPTHYSLTIPEVQALFDRAGLPRTVRSISRYCDRKTLDAIKVDGPSGPQWMVSSQSVDRAIEELKRVHSMSDTASQGQPGPGVSDEQTQPISTKTGPDTVSPGPTQTDRVEPETQDRGVDPRYLEQLETRIREKDEVIGILKNELVHRNEEIERRAEREKETNFLIRGLQNLVLQLQPARPEERIIPASEHFDEQGSQT